MATLGLTKSLSVCVYIFTCTLRSSLRLACACFSAWRSAAQEILVNCALTDRSSRICLLDSVGFRRAAIIPLSFARFFELFIYRRECDLIRFVGVH